MSEDSAKVLIVDDDPFVREILGFVLQAGGYDVEMAEDGEEALRLCLSAGEGFDAIVSDMNMPGMGGFELTRKLRESGLYMPILVLTGETEVAAAAEAVQCGANGYLVKDENIQDAILEALERALAEYRAAKMR